MHLKCSQAIEFTKKMKFMHLVVLQMESSKLKSFFIDCSVSAHMENFQSIHKKYRKEGKLKKKEKKGYIQYILPFNGGPSASFWIRHYCC